LVVACLALLIDTAACLFTVSEYRKCGHLHLEVMLTIMGIALSVLAVVAFRWWWKARRAGRTSPMSPRPGKRA